MPEITRFGFSNTFNYNKRDVINDTMDVKTLHGDENYTLLLLASSIGYKESEEDAAVWGRKTQVLDKLMMPSMSPLNSK